MPARVERVVVGFAEATGGFMWHVEFWGEIRDGMPVNPWHFEGYLEGTISY